MNKTASKTRNIVSLKMEELKILLDKYNVDLSVDDKTEVNRIMQELDSAAWHEGYNAARIDFEED